MTAGTTHFGELPAAMGPVGDPDARFSEAMRHSRRVRFLRRAIPLGALIGIGAIFFIAIYEPFRMLPDGVSIGNVSLNGTKITMELPVSPGSRDSRPYEVTARWAAQDIKVPNIIELKDLKSRIALADKSFATVEAASGVYDSQSEKMTLTHDVRIKTQTGYDVRMNSAQIEFKAGNVASTEPVSVRFNGGTIDASAVDMSDNGQHIIFAGPVRTTLQPDPDMKSASPASPKENVHEPPCDSPVRPVPRRARTGAAEAGIGRPRIRHELEGADPDRRGPAGSVQQGAAGHLHRQRRGHPGRYDDQVGRHGDLLRSPVRSRCKHRRRRQQARGPAGRHHAAACRGQGRRHCDLEGSGRDRQ